MQCPSGLLLNYQVFHFLKSAQVWIRGILDSQDSLVRRITSPHRETTQTSKVRNRKAGDGYAIRDMIVVVTVEIIAGWQMGALTRQWCQLVTMLEANKGLPSGITGCQLETQLTRNNERSNRLQHTDNDRWEVGKGKDIAMFRKSSIEDIVLMHLGKADHHRKKNSDRQSSGVFCCWSIVRSATYNRLMSWLGLLEYWISVSASVTNERS